MMSFCTTVVEDSAFAPEVTSIDTCANNAPDDPTSSGVRRNYAAFSCVDSKDCKSDELCVLSAPQSADLLAGSCKKMSSLEGEREVCGRGTCRLKNTSCQQGAAEPTWNMPPTCRAPNKKTACGAKTCGSSERCCSTVDGPRCQSQCDVYDGVGAEWECAENKDCPKSQRCCLTSTDSTQCAFSCSGRLAAC